MHEVADRYTELFPTNFNQFRWKFIVCTRGFSSRVRLLMMAYIYTKFLDIGSLGWIWISKEVDWIGLDMKYIVLGLNWTLDYFFWILIGCLCLDLDLDFNPLPPLGPQPTGHCCLGDPERSIEALNLSHRRGGARRERTSCKSTSTVTRAGLLAGLLWTKAWWVTEKDGTRHAHSRLLVLFGQMLCAGLSACRVPLCRRTDMPAQPRGGST